jgi:hypothetical protein
MPIMKKRPKRQDFGAASDKSAQNRMSCGLSVSAILTASLPESRNRRFHIINIFRRLTIVKFAGLELNRKIFSCQWRNCR